MLYPVELLGHLICQPYPRPGKASQAGMIPNMENICHFNGLADKIFLL